MKIHVHFLQKYDIIKTPGAKLRRTFLIKKEESENEGKISENRYFTAAYIGYGDNSNTCKPGIRSK